MRALFPEYYPLTEAELSGLYREGRFALDANVLLNLYKYSVPTRKEVLDQLAAPSVAERLFVPHRAALEFSRARLQVIQSVVASHEDVLRGLKSARSSVQTLLDKYKDYEKISPSQIRQPIFDALDRTCTVVTKSRDSQAKLLDFDDVLVALERLLDNRITVPDDDATLARFLKDAEVRRLQGRRPGLTDSGKDALTGDPNDKYGDVIIWHQILAVAARDKASVILVTDELKEDWLWKAGGLRSVGAFPTLRAEFRDFTGGDFHVLGTFDFLAGLRKYLRGSVSDQAIKEVQVVGEEAHVFPGDRPEKKTAGEAFVEETLQLRKFRLLEASAKYHLLSRSAFTNHAKREHARELAMELIQCTAGAHPLLASIGNEIAILQGWYLTPQDYEALDFVGMAASISWKIQELHERSLVLAAAPR